MEAKQGRATGWGECRSPCDSTERCGQAWLSELPARPAGQPARDLAGQHHCPVHPACACLRSLQVPWLASLEPPKPPNSTTPVSPFHHLFLPSQPPRQLCIY